MKRPEIFLRSVLLLGCLLLAPLMAFADAYTDGVSAYKAGQYQKALQHFKSALIQNPHDAKSVFYVGLTYTRAGNYEEGRRAFDTVIKMVPADDPIAEKARNNITVITKNQIIETSGSGKASRVLTTSLSRNSKENYLTHIIPDGKIVHFAIAKMPLKVFIQSGAKVEGWKSTMNTVVINAMRTWNAATRGKVRFVQTWNESEADIIVKWQRNFSDGILGVSPYRFVGNTIISSDVHLATFYPDSNTPIPLEDLKGIAIHEMGHAIGLKGHSPYPEDLMFWATNHQQGSSLTERDINTIGMLYNIDADVQNNTTMSTARTNQYYQLVEKGYKAQTSGQAAQAISFYRQAMAISRAEPDAKYNLAGVLYNEGIKLINQNSLQQARLNYEEAINLLQEVAQSGRYASETQELLPMARNNLEVVNYRLAHPNQQQ